MFDRTVDVNREDLERELGDLRRWVAYPPTPELASAATARLRGERPTDVRLLTGGRRSFAAAAAAIALLLGTAALSETVRDAVADALGIPGIRIELIDDDPTAAPGDATPDLGLGEQLSLSAANAALAVPVIAPEPDRFGLPDAIFLRRLPDGTDVVSLVFQPDERLPETAETGVGLLLMQFRTDAGTLAMVKSIARDGIVRGVSIDGAAGFWIEGTTQLTIAGSDTRATANVLIWQANGVSYRLESALPMEQTIAIAERMTVLRPSDTTPAMEP